MSGLQPEPGLRYNYGEVGSNVSAASIFGANPNPTAAVGARYRSQSGLHSRKSALTPALALALALALSLSLSLSLDLSLALTLDLSLALTLALSLDLTLTLALTLALARWPLNADPEPKP